MARSKRILSPADDDSDDALVSVKNKKTRSNPGSDDIESGSRVRKPSKAQQNIGQCSALLHLFPLLAFQFRQGKSRKTSR